MLPRIGVVDAAPARAAIREAFLTHVIGSGGVLRHGDDAVRRVVLAPLRADHGGGWRALERAALVVDESYLLFAAGLLAAERPAVAARLATEHLVPVES